jgi:hypothetical protein
LAFAAIQPSQTVSFTCLREFLFSVSTFSCSAPLILVSAWMVVAGMVVATIQPC